MNIPKKPKEISVLVGKFFLCLRHVKHFKSPLDICRKKNVVLLAAFPSVIAKPCQHGEITDNIANIHKLRNVIQ